MIYVNDVLYDYLFKENHSRERKKQCQDAERTFESVKMVAGRVVTSKEERLTKVLFGDMFTGELMQR